MQRKPVPPIRLASSAIVPAGAKTNTASRSTKRRISHAVAARLILMPRLVTQYT
jgi:hypothetical protein